LNTAGQLGIGTTEQQLSPTMTNISSVSGASAGDDFSMILKKDGTVQTFGGNYYGQLGDGTVIQRNSPVSIASENFDIIAISCGALHSLILKKNGVVFAFGDNSKGQLGDESNINRLTPTHVHGPYNMDVVKISTGLYHSAFVTTKGLAYSFGQNNDFQLGDGTKDSSKLPVLIKNSGDNITNVHCSGFHTLYESGSPLVSFGVKYFVSWYSIMFVLILNLLIQ
jgi:alpha-tubulin suppressor-like RCC1 family protein